MEKNENEQFTHDILRKDNVMDRALQITTLGDEPKQHVRKAHKKTRMVVEMM